MGFPEEVCRTVEAIEPQGKTTEFQCPKCELRLEVGLIHENMQACFCPNCRGFVIPTQTLGELVQKLRAAYDGADDRPQPIDPGQLAISENCPACLETMEAHPYYGPGNIVLDTCRHCQLACLDHGELSKIIRAPGLRPGR